MKYRLNFKNTKTLIISALALALVILLYILFWKPNPVVRIDANKYNGVSERPALYFDAPTEVSNVGKTLTVKIRLNTKGNIVNAVQSIIEFDPNALEVVNTDTKTSFCKFYPENNYNNEKGNVRLACGAPYPGFNGENTLETIEFLTKATKTTKLKIGDKSMVLANDGKGTNLLETFESVQIRIKPTL